MQATSEIVKLIELCDRATFIPMVALRFDCKTEAERYLMSRAGFGCTEGIQKEYIIFGRLDCEQPYHYAPWRHTNERTYRVAHSWIASHWNEIESGDVIDVEYILGETKEKKLSERLTCDY